MHLDSEAEETALIRGGGEVGYQQGFQSLLAPPGYGDLLQISRAGDLGDGRRIDGGGEELGPGEDFVDEDVVDSQQWGSNAVSVWLLF